MNYKESLLELIKSKKDISESKDNIIAVSIADIADNWNKTHIWQKPDFITGYVSLDNNFLEDICLMFRKLEKENLLKISDIKGEVMDFVKKEHPNEISKDMILNFKHLASLEDKIFFETTNEFDKLKNKNIILKIDTTRKTITRETEKGTLKYSFRKSNGKNKRFEYLVKIAQNPKIGAKALNSKAYQTTSSEIAKINNAIKIKLNLVEDLIINDRNSGYEINKIYSIDFV